MNNKNIKKLCFLVIFSLLLAANGCSLKSDKQILDNTNINGNQTVQSQTPENDPTEESDEVDSAKLQENKTDTTDLKETEAPTVKPVATKEISIYTINEETKAVESAVALVPADSEITPELIIDQVTDSLADSLVEIGVDTVTTKKDAVIVSFKSDQPPLTNVGGGLEKSILDAVAQSLVDNLKDYPKVIFRVEGQAYSSKNYSFGLDQVYLDNSKTK